MHDDDEELIATIEIMIASVLDLGREPEIDPIDADDLETIEIPAIASPPGA